MKKAAIISAVISAFCVCCSDSSDAKKIAKELAEALTDALVVENGKEVAEPPPEGSSGQDAPQIAEIQGSELREGAPFAFKIVSSFTNYYIVNKALVVAYNEGVRADKYIEAAGYMTAGYFEVKGTLSRDARLTGKSFELAFALETADGKIGLFKKFKAQVKSSDELEVEAEAETEMEFDGDAEYELEELIEYPEYEEAAEAEEETATARSFPTGFCASSFCLALAGTGQTKCYDESAQLATCAGGVPPVCGDAEPTIYCGQDAQYSKAETAFVCNNSAGAQVDCSALSMPMDGETVEDKTTGLIWQRIFLQNQSWSQAVSYCSTLTYANVGGWRLPNVFELASIADLSVYDPSIHPNAFMGTSYNWPFWSSNESSENASAAWYVQYGIGGNGLTTKTDATQNVRCVRGGPTDSGTGSYEHFTTSGTSEPIIVDNVTGLVWQQVYATGKKWTEALYYCEQSGYASKTDWRLPNVKELVSLLNYGRDNPASDFPDASNEMFWSSTTAANPTTQAWAVDFQFGAFLGDSKTATHSVKCVRGTSR